MLTFICEQMNVSFKTVMRKETDPAQIFSQPGQNVVYRAVIFAEERHCIRENIELSTVQTVGSPANVLLRIAHNDERRASFR